MIPWTLLLLSLPPSPAAPVPPQEVDGLIQWVYDYAEGQRLARAAGKPLFVVFRCER